MIYLFYRERELNYISSIQTIVGYSGWLRLNLTSCLATWVAFPDSNKGLYLSVHPTNKPGKDFFNCYFIIFPCRVLYILKKEVSIQLHR